MFFKSVNFKKFPLFIEKEKAVLFVKKKRTLLFFGLGKKWWTKKMDERVILSPIFKKIRNSNYLTIRGGSLKKIAKKIIPNVPINKKV